MKPFIDFTAWLLGLEKRLHAFRMAVATEKLWRTSLLLGRWILANQRARSGMTEAASYLQHSEVKRLRTVAQQSLTSFHAYMRKHDLNYDDLPQQMSERVVRRATEGKL